MVNLWILLKELIERVKKRKKVKRTDSTYKETLQIFEEISRSPLRVSAHVPIKFADLQNLFPIVERFVIERVWERLKSDGVIFLREEGFRGYYFDRTCFM